MPTPARRRPSPSYVTPAARRLRSARTRRRRTWARAAEVLWGSSWLVRQTLVALALFLVVFALLKAGSPALADLQAKVSYYLTVDYDIRGAAQQVMSSNLREKVAGGLRLFPDLWNRLTGRNQEEAPPEGTSFVWPVAGGQVTSRFGYRPDPITGDVTFHTGIDIGAAEGTPVLAALGGKVLSVEENESYGRTVEVDHGRGIITLYAHCRDILVSTGDTVEQGDQIATVGMTGRATTPHLHFEVIVSGRPVDPLGMPGLAEGG